MSDRGNKSVQHYEQDMGTNNLDATYDQVSASLAQDVAKVRLSSSVAVNVLLAVGAAASEVVQCTLCVPANGSTESQVLLNKGARVAIKSLTGTVLSGVLALDLYN